jgi:hypothetical protein
VADTSLNDLPPVQRVIWLLRSFYDVRETWTGKAGDGGVGLMPKEWHEGSYAELERCCALLRDSPNRPLWFHATRRYRDGEHRTVLVHFRRGAKGPVFYLPDRCELESAGGSIEDEYRAKVRVYQWAQDVDQKVADRGVSAIAQLMYQGDTRKIQLPDVVYRLALGLPLRDAA